MKRILVLVLLLSACSEPSVQPLSRSSAIGTAGLWSEVSQSATVHVLFVPDFDPPPRSAIGHSGGGGLGRERGEVHFSYTDSIGNVSVPPVVIVDNKFVEYGTRRFDLAAGNLFVIHFARDGRASAIQVHRFVMSASDPAALLEVIKSALPNDARMQALRASS